MTFAPPDLDQQGRPVADLVQEGGRPGALPGASGARSARSGGSALRVVVDANVWVSGLIDPDSSPGRVLQAIRAGRIEPVVTWELAEEVVDVLRRPRIRRYGVTGLVTEALALLGPFLPTVEADVPIRGPKDGPWSRLPSPPAPTPSSPETSISWPTVPSGCG